MKLTQIYLKKYLNFREDFKIDLTYPQGHPNSGEPLKKICFIGQSCTGKTSLLNLIKYISFFREEVDKSSIQEEYFRDGNIEIFYELGHRSFSKKIDKDGNVVYSEKGNVQGPEYEKIILGELSKNKPALINFPFNIIEIGQLKKQQNKKFLPSDLTASPEKIRKEEINLEQKKLLARNQMVWDFSIHEIYELWNIVFDEISIYKKNLDREKDKFIESVDKNVENTKEYLEALNKWKEDHGNPIKKLASTCLDEILKSLNLQTKTDLNFEDERDLQFINVFQSNDKSHVPFEFVSTGAKQVILTAIPLFFLGPKEAIILFDQAETSLYPDIQMKLVETYQALTTDSQLFFATHSPVIASAFEPWEIIELKFDETKGTTYQLPYYKGERHVDNYIKDPRYLRWDTLYMKFFGLKEEGNETFRDRELMKAKRLKSQLDMLRANGKEKDRDFLEKQKEYIISAKKLDWDL